MLRAVAKGWALESVSERKQSVQINDQTSDLGERKLRTRQGPSNKYPVRRGLGVGLGLRTPHYSHILENRPSIPWFEAISENYMGIKLDSDKHWGGRPLEILNSVRAHYPVVLHGVSLSIGSSDPLNFSYLDRLAALVKRIEPAWVSDHLCWTGVSGENVHDLLPLPYTEEALRHLSSRIDQVQNHLKRPLAMENVSAYLNFSHSEMTEWEFLVELTRRTGCQLLLDINNVYVSSVNQKFNARDFLQAIPAAQVAQIHLAGHSKSGDLLIDTHDGPVCDGVWELFRDAIRLWGDVPTLIEWDDQIPEFSVLQGEAERAQSIVDHVIQEKAHEQNLTDLT